MANLRMSRLAALVLAAPWVVAGFNCPPARHGANAAAVMMKGSEGTFLPVLTNQPPGTTTAMEVAIIAVHDHSADAETYFEDAVKAARGSGKLDTTLVVAPAFPDQFCTSNMWAKGGWAKVSQVSLALTWTGGLWMFGMRSDGAAGNEPSSFAALDAVITWVHEQYPGVKKIQLVGFDHGAEMLARWAILSPQGQNKKSVEGLPLSVVVAAPSRLPWLSEERPTLNCTTAKTTEKYRCNSFDTPKQGDFSFCDGLWNSYGFGAGGKPEGNVQLATTWQKNSAQFNEVLGKYLESQGEASSGAEVLDKKLLKRFLSKDVKYLFGAKDNVTCTGETCGSTCGAMVEGTNRLQRGLNYMGHLKNAGGAANFEIFKAAHNRLGVFLSARFADTTWKLPVLPNFLTLPRVVLSEGYDVADLERDGRIFTPQECAVFCLGTEGCMNFAYHGLLGACHFKDKCITADDVMVEAGSDRAAWMTFYLPCTPPAIQQEYDSDDPNNQVDYLYKSTERAVLDQGAITVGGARLDRTYTVYECESLCDLDEHCSSFSFGLGECILRNKCVAADAPLVDKLSTNAKFKTFYKPCTKEGKKVTGPSQQQPLVFSSTIWGETERVVLDEGNGIANGIFTDQFNTVGQCKAKCDKNPSCQSIAWGRGLCWLKAKCLKGTEPVVDPFAHNAVYKSYFKKGCGFGAGASSASAQPDIKLFLASPNFGGSSLGLLTSPLAAAAVACSVGAASALVGLAWKRTSDWRGAANQDRSLLMTDSYQQDAQQVE